MGLIGLIIGMWVVFRGVKIGSGVRVVGVLVGFFLLFLWFLMVFYPFFRVFDQQLTGFCCRK